MSSSSAQLRADGISHSFGHRRVLTDISFTVSAGQRTGLIGENGSGKSTLLRILAGLLPADGGVVSVTAPTKPVASIGLLHQEPPFKPSDTVAEALEAAIAPVRAAAAAVDSAAEDLAAQPEDERVAAHYAAALDEAERTGAWQIDSQVDATMEGLGIQWARRDRPTGDLSGGQRARLALAWILLNRPDTLLLDEPTNHLDDAAIHYLGGILAQWKGPVLFASHDRAFLDETATRLIDLDPAPLPHSVAGPLVQDGTGTGIGLTAFTGSYTDYLHERIDSRDRWWRQYRDEQLELKRLRQAVEDNHTVGHPGREPRTEARAAKKFYADRNATVVSRRVNDSRRRLEELDQEQIRRPPETLSFQGLAPGENLRQPRGSGPLVTVSQVSFEHRLRETSFSIAAGQKWLITGPNGAGKSTLLHLMAGRLEPTGGGIHRPEALSIGLLAQENELPDVAGRGPWRTASQAYADLVGASTAEAVPLSTFGLIPGRDQNQPVDALSVGQQRRLALAVVLAHPPELLLLDEPTNHFGLVLATQLEAAIPEYPGAVVVASHDRWLRHSWTGERLELAGSTSSTRAD